ncbi:MAG: hypothetical protein ACREQC_14465, partial [Candidatus Binataceae bacterium]
TQETRILGRNSQIEGMRATGVLTDSAVNDPTLTFGAGLFGTLGLEIAMSLHFGASLPFLSGG